MAPTARKPPIAGLRRLLLAALMVVVAVVAVTFIVRRDEPPAAVEEDGGPRPEGEITLIGEGFEFTQSEGERTIFHIEGESVKVRQGSSVLLEGVALTLYDEEGRPYRVEAEEASYDRESRDAELRGDPLRLVGPDGMVLIADGLKVFQDGRRIETVGPTELLFGELYRATARRAEARLGLNHFNLLGEVHLTRMEGDPAPTLDADSLVYMRDERLMHAGGRAELRWGADFVIGDLLVVRLSEDERRTVLLRARGSVVGLFRSGGPAAAGADGGEDGDRAPAAIRLHGDDLVLYFYEDRSEPERVELEGGPNGRARLVSRTAGGLVDTLIADRVNARLLPEGGREVEATGSPRLTETRHGAPAGEKPLREVDVGGRLEAKLDRDGVVERLSGDGGVELRTPETTARGDRLTYTGAEAKTELFGAPVRAESPRGELVAPHVIYEQEAGLLWAEGGVRAVLAEESGIGLDGSPLAAGEGPVRVESELAFWRDEPPSVLFRGGVRAWRGRSLLLAEDLRGDRAEGEETLTASGDVKTVWRGRPGEGAGGEGAGGDDGGGEEAAAGDPAETPIEVTARTMTYRRPVEAARGTVLYRGDVRSEQGERELSCRELEVELDDDGRAERMTCTGSVRLVDRATGNVATGERAVYDLEQRTVDVTGEPVLLTKGDGGQVEGRRVLYEVDAGRARVLSGAAESPPQVVEEGPAGGGER